MPTETEVLVVGGGITGCGVARDLATRGVDVTLVERDGLTSGTSGAMHGVLHSGARYAVDDETSARECITENRVLREIAPHCVAATGGLFVARPEDDDGYVERKREACESAGIPVEPLDGAAARDAEPSLAEDVDRALRVPDGVVDPFALAVATAVDASDRGARVETGTAVTDLLVEDGRVVGAETDAGRVRADHVVNAAGPWAGRVAGMADLDVEMRPSRGAMLVVDHAIETVLNRCRPRTEGDIVVPYGSTCVLGTTDETVADPDDHPTEERELDLLVEELSALVPAVREADRLHAYWGVRPLYDPSGGAVDETDATRGFAVLDHADDGRPGLTSVVGGKLTTYRLMAEATADAVCAALGVDADCRTADEPLPDPEPADYERFGVDPPAERRPL